MIHLYILLGLIIFFNIVEYFNEKYEHVDWWAPSGAAIVVWAMIEIIYWLATFLYEIVL